jgi:hypothetical protein
VTLTLSPYHIGESASGQCGPFVRAIEKDLPIDESGQLAPVFSQPADGPDAVELDRVVSRGQPGLPNVVEAFYYSDGYEPEGTIAISMGTGRFPGGKGKPIEIRPWLH